MQERAIKVFIVDDSAIARTTIGTLLEGESDISLHGVASDPIIAESKFERFGWPDVIILDIEMPRMDGLTFLRKIMLEHPTPVIICSSVAQKGSSKAIEALFLGAVEVIAKPEVGLKIFLEESKYTLIHAIKAAYESKSSMKQKTIFSKPRSDKGLSPKIDADAILPLKSKLSHNLTHPLIVIGSSTGGVQTLERIIPFLTQKTPPILIVQHMPEGFTRSLSERLNRMCTMFVKEAKDGDKLCYGHVLIAPGNKHMTLKRSANTYVVEIKDGPKVSRHKPSIDVLFRSCANEAGVNGMGFILTGMGDDGAKGLKEMKERGAKTYAQNKESCIVYGMPKVAVELGAVMEVLTLEEIVETIKRSENVH
ncbi:protein-glutamate methylesterase/protein-glutamine glutaminase [Sulfurospirillum oryzae]|uniref:protein-glutamate methylesterase/protein-glutamine glutaminase n=1 Tax=Sulfurospirillum oryzae TaxID=2976535 RepID=UPI0021E78A4F|nr:chemotaxis response regulator protein-glutamate methylesterase [Sulfurospirillum oryzae]